MKERFSSETPLNRFTEQLYGCTMLINNKLGRWQMRLMRYLSPLNSKLSPVRQGYSWMGDHLGIALC